MTASYNAQKALAAFNERYELCGPFDDDWVEQCLAAALEAVADQVVPHFDEPDWGACDEMRCDIELYTDHPPSCAAPTLLTGRTNGPTNHH